MSERRVWLCPNGCTIHGGEEPPGHFCRRTTRWGRNRAWITARTRVEDHTNDSDFEAALRFAPIWEAGE